MKKVALYIFFVCLGCSLQAQSPDARFSQFYAAPLQLNPALNGVFDGSFRLVANYRDQWASILDTDPFRTLAFSFDYRQRVFEGDYFAMGFDVLGDQAGISKLRNTRANVNFSYLKRLVGGRGADYAQYLIAGGQVGAGQAQVDFSDLWFTSQFDMSKEEIDFALDNMESINESSDVYFNANVGLMWYGVIDKDFSVYAGAAVNHVNQPQFSFLDDQTHTMFEKWVIHAGAQIPLGGDAFSILPAAVYLTQGPSNSSTFGFNVRYSNNERNELAIRAGTWLHLSNELESSTLTDALIFTGALEFDAYQFGFSCDINTSSARNLTAGRGGFELSFIYIHPSRERRLQVKCPKF